MRPFGVNLRQNKKSGGLCEGMHTPVVHDNHYCINAMFVMSSLLAKNGFTFWLFFINMLHLYQTATPPGPCYLLCPGVHECPTWHSVVCATASVFQSFDIVHVHLHILIMACIDEYMCSSRFSLVFIHIAYGSLYGFSYNNTTHSQR